MEIKPLRKGLIARLKKIDMTQREFAAPVRSFDDHSTLELLIDTLHDADVALRTDAARALVDMGETAVPALLLELRDEDGLIWRLAAGVLVKIGAPAVQPLLAALTTRRESEAVQILLVEILGQIGDTRAAETLIQTLDSESSPLRTAAAVALVRIGPAATPVLLAALAESRSDTFRQHAIPILKQIGATETLDTLAAWQAIDELLD